MTAMPFASFVLIASATILASAATATVGGVSVTTGLMLIATVVLGLLSWLTLLVAFSPSAEPQQDQPRA